MQKRLSRGLLMTSESLATKEKRSKLSVVRFVTSSLMNGRVTTVEGLPSSTGFDCS